MRRNCVWRGEFWRIVRGRTIFKIQKSTDFSVDNFIGAEKRTRTFAGFTLTSDQQSGTLPLCHFCMVEKRGIEPLSEGCHFSFNLRRNHSIPIWRARKDLNLNRQFWRLVCFQLHHTPIGQFSLTVFSSDTHTTGRSCFRCSSSNTMELKARIELATLIWKNRVLPLNYLSIIGCGGGIRTHDP